MADKEMELFREFAVSTRDDVLRITHHCGWAQEFAHQCGFEELVIAVISHSNKAHA